MTNPKYTISIAVHNNLEATIHCLESIAQWCLGDQFEVIVTDNGSTEHTRNHLLAARDWMPGLVLIRRESNEGFPLAHNQALRIARGAYFLILNNDVLITGKNLLQKMSSALDSDQFLGLCGADNAPSELDMQGHGVMGPRTEYIEGSCLMGKTDLLRMFGLFDPAYEFAYCEDADLSLRLRLGGYRLLRLRLPIRHERRGTGADLSEVDRERLEVAYRKNHETLRARWRAYLACKDRFLAPETQARPVAIVTLNRFPELAEALLRGLGDLPEWQQGIIVADRQPTLRALYPGWRVLAGADPFAFARNANIGIAAAGHSDVVLVNDDVTGLTPEGILELQRIAYRYPDVGILASSVTGEIGNRVQPPDGTNRELVVSQQRLCFVCVYLRRQVLRHLGLLDERFTGYGGDDCEHCLRAQEAGYKLGITRRVVVHHAGSSSFRRVMPEEERLRQMREMDVLVRQKWGTDGHSA